ncbi:MAG: DUF1264 domain-containing protein [Planctomycetes bacterium]|nr:DUF1264 domain-containing protein [Planctomycetota bacterium]
MQVAPSKRNPAALLAALVALLVPFFLAPIWSSGEDPTPAAPGTKSENWVPVQSMHLYLCAFHVAKADAAFQVEAHHYCSPQGDKLHQCVVYDGRGAKAKLLGVEYIVGDDVYQKLPAAEKKYWHPHAYEIMSGQLVAPDMPKQGDDVFPGLINTWGKTWHTWRDPATEFPLGEPLLMWSANGDGQLKPGLVDARDKQFGISTAEIRERRRAFGFPVPNLPEPKSMEDLGRRWTTEGADQPAGK